MGSIGLYYIQNYRQGSYALLKNLNNKNVKTKIWTWLICTIHSIDSLYRNNATHLWALNFYDENLSISWTVLSLWRYSLYEENVPRDNEHIFKVSLTKNLLKWHINMTY